jgi:hypothetical protein
VNRNIRSTNNKTQVAATIYVILLMYYFQGETIFALLPYKITKENNSEVIIRTYEAAEKTDKLYEIQYTNMAKHKISILWLVD